MTPETLLVADDPNFAKQASEIFASHGHHTTTAENIEKAHALLDTQKIHFVVLNMGFSPEETAEIVNEFRRKSPNLKLVRVGRTANEVRSFSPRFSGSYQNVYIPLDASQAVTIKKIEFVKKQLEFAKCIGSVRSRSILILFLIGSVFGLSFLSDNPVIQFLGVFWPIVLMAEFLYYLHISRKELDEHS